jgi:PKD repeat protein
MAHTPPIRYPDDIDGDDNLYQVHDALRLRLAEDYNPGDTRLVVEGDLFTLTRWPEIGIVTLTEQCSDIDKRALSFYYTGVDVDRGEITGLILDSCFEDVKKPKRITNVLINVVDEHHNKMKDALIAIQEFIGVEGTLDTRPFGSTLEGRINFLRKIALQPRAWFKANKLIGNVPLEVEFVDQSFRLGTDGTTGPVVITWDFGDNSTSTVSTISATSVAPDVPDAYVIDMDGGKIKKTYYKAGLYDVKLTVKNDFGQDECVFQNLINARIPAPNEAVITFDPSDNQTATPGSPTHGPYTVVPKIRSPINTLIQIDIEAGENSSTPDYTFAGEPLNEVGDPLDPIVSYTWNLGDDLNHPNSPSTKAAYTVGGIYDLKLRVDTEFGAYRITTYENAIDIVENTNLWMWLYTNLGDTLVRGYEYGLISETFKLRTNSTYLINRNASFLNGAPDEAAQKKEFRKNTGFAPRGTTNSGSGGSVLLYWASGRSSASPASSEEIRFVEYNGFEDTYIARNSISRPWNWATFSSPSQAFFCFGTTGDATSPNVSPTNLTKTKLDLNSLTTTSSTMTVDDFENGGQELMQNPALYNGSGVSIHGHYSVTRTAWKDNTGYIARNDGVGDFFRMKSFYRTEGSVGNPFKTIRKLIDIQGPTKLEGQLGDLTDGVFLFNNSGSISAYSVSSSTWSTGGPGINSVAYRALQDTTTLGFDSSANTMLCATDKYSWAYLSFDYSTRSFLKFSASTLTFSALGSRPEGDQLVMGVY